VLAKLEMSEYNDVVHSAFTVGNDGVGGSEECANAIAEGHKEIGDMMRSDSGREILAKLFALPSAQWLENPDNQKAFAGNGVADFPAQSNDPSCKDPACDIGSICRIMLNSSLGDTVHKLAAVRAAQGPQKKFVRRQLFRSFRQLQQPTDEPDYWGYQTCTEFAFYQTCEVGSKCFFTQGLILLDDFFSECRDVWGIPDTKVAENVNYTNSYYGGLSPSGSRVLYPSGQVDPWSSLSIRAAPNPELPAFTVPGASHHFWTHPSLPSDQSSVKDARTKIWAQVNQWLKED